MTEKTIGERADQLSRRRARMFPLLAIVFLAQQASFLTDAHGLGRAVDHVKVGAWVVMSLALLIALYTGGSWFRGREMRDLLNDETTRANRAIALSQGFLAAMLTAIVGYFVHQFEPVRGDELAHLVVTAGIAIAMIRFGVLEKRALGDA